MRNKLLTGGACLTALLIAGCIKDFNSEHKQATSSDYFNFEINQSTALEVDYGFPNKDYAVLCEVYDQNPMTQNQEGEFSKRDIEPIYRAATDGTGRITADIEIPAYLSTVWIYSEYPGVISPIEVEVKDGKISFNQNAYIAQQRISRATRATTGNQHTYPNGWLTLGDWDQYGTPDNLEAQRTLPPAQTLYNINEVFLSTKRVKLKERFPQFFAPGLSSELKVVKPTKIYLVFINSTATWKNTIGYFTYPTGQEPSSVADMKRIVAFPSASPFIRKAGETMVRGALSGGDRIQLKYWDGKQFQDEFPANVTIGWWLEGMGFEATGNLAIQSKGFFSRFSLEQFNANQERYTVALRDSKNAQIVAIGFEDNIDLLYNDAAFYLEVEKSDAIDSNVPLLPDVANGPTDDQNYVKTEGFLMFEDLWPYTGDYDMNDVMLKYSSKVYKHVLNNSVYKVETEYTPYHNGGRIQSGFGVQFTGLSAETIHKVTITGTAPSSYMEGQMLEPGQSSPTLILFDVIEKNTEQKAVVTVEFNDAPESQIVPPFNPFIFTDADKMRGKEVHLVKHRPTDKADQTLFGTGKDGSSPKSGIYYVLQKNEKQYPFALNMPFMQEVPIPAEGTNIDISYPKFRNWVESNGKSNKDWFLYPANK